MMQELQRWLMWACLAALAGGGLAWLAVTMFPRLRRLLSTGAMAMLAAVAVYWGGAKNIMPKTGHDDTSPYDTLVSAEAFSAEAVTNVPGYEVRCQYPYGTNGFAVVLGFSPGIPDNDILSRFWFRDSDREDWTSLLSALDGAQNTWIDVGATNYFVCISEVTNRFSHAQYWFGEDLPAKVVDGGEGGVELVSLFATSNSVVARIAVDASAVRAGSVALVDRSWQVRDSRYAWEEWETVWSGPAVPGTNDVVVSGFQVHRRSRWRARLRTEVDE